MAGIYYVRIHVVVINMNMMNWVRRFVRVVGIQVT
jgi:hypothetical protein